MTFIAMADVSCKLNMYKEQKKCYTRKHKDNLQYLNNYKKKKKMELFMLAEARTCAPTG